MPHCPMNKKNLLAHVRFRCNSDTLADLKRYRQAWQARNDGNDTPSLGVYVSEWLVRRYVTEALAMIDAAIIQKEKQQEEMRLERKLSSASTH